MEVYIKNQLGEMLPYQYEPEVRENTDNKTDQRNSKQESTLSSDEEIDNESEKANTWHLQTLRPCSHEPGTTCYPGTISCLGV